MKILLIIIALIVSFTTLSAQSNSLKAKAAHILAEEAFAVMDFSSAIYYLDERKIKIRSPNSKIIYL